jgi:PHD/YefM family antitoxin component YafN of YafNO toxin-antitoxin module
MTIELHPEFLTKNGQKQFVVLSYEEFELIKETLEDLEDLKLLRSAKAESHNENSIPLDTVKEQFGLI